MNAKVRHVMMMVILMAATLFVAGCQSFRLEVGFKQPADLTATAQAQLVAPTPTPKPQLGKLAFVRGGDIWIKELPDGDELRLTQDGRNSEPRWSASGEWLGYLKDDQVWVARADGTGSRLVKGWAPAELFAWSPSEDRLASIIRGGLSVELADGSERREVVHELEIPSLSLSGKGVNAIAWSSDGQWIAFEKWESTSPVPPTSQGLWRAKADGSEVQAVYLNPNPLLTQSYLAGWSPDGQNLLFWRGVQMSLGTFAEGAPLMSVSVSGSTPVTVSQSVVLPYTDFLAWSPDGQRLAYVDGGKRGTWENKAIATTTLAGDFHNLSDGGRADVFPSWSPDGRQIAFTSGPASPGNLGGENARQPLSQRQIWLQGEDGSGKRQLTNDTDYRDERPLWSADGSYILFNRFRGDQAQVWLMRADGSEKRRVVDELTPSPNWFGNFSYVDWGQYYDWWSGPKGRSSTSASTLLRALLAATSIAASTPVSVVAPPPVLVEEGAAITENGLYVADTVTGKVWRADNSFPQWSWSPDGKTLARTLSPCCGQTDGLDLLDFTAGSATRILKGGIESPVWSPDGKQLAFTRLAEHPDRPSSAGDEVGLYTIGRDGSGLKQHSLLPGITNISWSPRGDYLAFSVWTKNVYVMRLADDELTEVVSASNSVTFAWARDSNTLIYSAPSGLYSYDIDTMGQQQIFVETAGEPIISPNGSQILFSSGHPGDFFPPDAHEFFVAGLQYPESVRPLLTAQIASWSPDDKRIAYLNNGCQGKGGDWDVYTMQTDGTAVRKLTDMPKDFKEGPYWSPTGTNIAFKVGGRVMLVDADSGDLRTLAISGGNTPLPFHMHGSPWSPDGRYVVFQFGLGHGYCE